MLTVLGCDVSQAQGAMVLLRVDNNAPDPRRAVELSGAWFMATKQYVVDAAAGDPGVGIATRVLSPTGCHKSTTRMLRLRAWRELLHNALATATYRGWMIDLVALEDYAYKASHGAHQTGETGGVVRSYLFERGYRLREFPPASARMFWTGSGNADKGAVIEAMRRLYPRVTERFARYDFPKSHEVYEGMMEALANGMLGAIELLLRSGRLHTMDLQPPHEVRVFNRVVKPYDTNLLAAPFCEAPR